MEEFYEKLKTEIQRQDDKYGDCDYHPLSWLPILGEEIGEISRAVNESSHNIHQMDMENYELEIIQSAAVLAQMWKNIKKYKEIHNSNT